MKQTGNLRKMKSELSEVVHYEIPLYSNTEPSTTFNISSLIGKPIKITFANNIHCVVTGKKIKKTYGEGMSWDAFKSSPMAVESIIRPELSQAHLGIGLRDLEWEIKHDCQPHIVYLSLTSGLKVGVTRKTQIPTRWIDQGAHEAIILAETPYRQAAGLIEVALKKHISDRTNWRKMLTNICDYNGSLSSSKNELFSYFPVDLIEFFSKENKITKINYPVKSYPEKIKSIKLDSNPIIEKQLDGIKGQYLIFNDNTVLNIRSHSGYEITIEG